MFLQLKEKYEKVGFKNILFLPLAFEWSLCCQQIFGSTYKRGDVILLVEKKICFLQPAAFSLWPFIGPFRAWSHLYLCHKEPARSNRNTPSRRYLLAFQSHEDATSWFFMARDCWLLEIHTAQHCRSSSNI